MKKVLTTFLIIIAICAVLFVIYSLKNRDSGVFILDGPGMVRENECWKITDFGNKEGNQMMGYTIEGDVYGLIIVDGGWESDDVIQQHYIDAITSHNNTVDAWILTHYDLDHAGAYMAIKNKIPDLKVEKFYVQGFPDIELCKEKAPWEADWTLYERYIALDESERTIVTPGFEDNDIIGLKFRVLSVYEPWMDAECTSLLNTGSMVFKLYGKEESILYCADVTDTKIEKRIMENFKEDIPSDYVQLPHHGNNVFSKEFYELVNPKKAIFDSPTNIFYNVNKVSWYTIENTRKMFEDMGVEIVSFETAPNFIVMK